MISLVLMLAAGWATLRSDQAAFQSGMLARNEDRDRRVLALEIARIRDDQQTAETRVALADRLASMEAAIRQLTMALAARIPPARNQ
ncbi:hypothetical protein [Sandarakinorhabdus sp.]|uniref:hypothetical protein n=1 Tax=Sandarakinorhabdus sp. TaxID=1916663 RepID=UPI0035626147